VSTSSFGRKLRREITKSPKKAAALGLVALVAVYFWTPLVMKWTGMNKPSSAGAVVKDTGVKAAPQAAASETTPTKEKTMKQKWRDVVKWIADDPRMKPTPGAKRNVFVLPKKQETVLPGAIADVPFNDVTPEEAGLVLSSTMVGTQRRIARISGETYGEGSTVVGSYDDAEFLLVAVEPRRVVLERNARRYELTLPTATERETSPKTKLEKRSTKKTVGTKS
jgi:hypothetical protein